MTMNEKDIKKYNKILIIIFILLLGCIYIGSLDVLTYKYFNIPSNNATNTMQELTSESVVTQNFKSSGDYIDSIEILFGTYNRINYGEVVIEIQDTNNNVLGKENIQMETLKDNEFAKIKFNKPVQTYENQELKLVLSVNPKLKNSGITIYIHEDKSQSSVYTIGNVLYDGQICFAINGKLKRNWNNYFLGISFIVFILFNIYIFISNKKFQKGKSNLLLRFEKELYEYKFLIKQLVSRDFKTKYKRSILGFCWSFLNPLLTMAVQYVVFSTIFRSNIENFPVYLLTAGIFFNFFTESVGNGLGSIVGNASLITKVYVPKYIYPVTKVLSTSINLYISTIPLLIVVIITGGKITEAILLFPFLFGCLILFCIGMSFILSTFMVYFRDTQFLWGIISLLWMYATPIFYPEEIIPAKFIWIQKLNPMYHFIKSGRTILLTGISPEPIELMICFIFAIVFLLIGYFIFNKNQNKFILYI